MVGRREEHSASSGEDPPAQRDMNAKVRGAKSSGAKRRLKPSVWSANCPCPAPSTSHQEVLKRRIARAKKKGKDTKARDSRLAFG